MMNLSYDLLISSGGVRTEHIEVSTRRMSEIEDALDTAYSRMCSVANLKFNYKGKKNVWHINYRVEKFHEVQKEMGFDVREVVEKYRKQ